MSENDELGDFDEFGDAPDSEEDPDDTDGTVELVENDDEEKIQNLTEELVEARADVSSLRPLDEENPLGLDPRVGVKDLAFDRAKPGAKVYVVDLLAESVPDYYEEFPDAPALDEYGGNVLVRYRDADAVFACVYVKDSLTSVDSNLTAYPMPESRLTRYPAEEASMVGSASAEFDRSPVPDGLDEQAAEVMATVLTRIWGQNPQIPVGDTDGSKVVDALREEFDEATVEEAVRRAGYEGDL